MEFGYSDENSFVLIHSQLLLGKSSLNALTRWINPKIQRLEVEEQVMLPNDQRISMEQTVSPDPELLIHYISNVMPNYSNCQRFLLIIVAYL